MKIPFSVFTAHHGYKWANIPIGMTEAQLTRYEKIISGTRPEYMKEGEHFDGILYDGNIVVVFTAMRVPEWDLARRTAHYYALAFIPRTECRKVNIDQLLNCDSFKTPMREPPTEIEYTGAPSDTTPTDVLAEIKAGQIKVLDFSYCGDLLSNNEHLGVKWQIFRTNVSNWNGSAFVFEPNQLVFSMSQSMSALTSAFPKRSDGSNRPPTEQSPILEPRTISLDRSDDPTYQLELRLARKIEKLKKERENDILDLQSLKVVVSRLKVLVYGLFFVTLLLLLIAVLDRNRIQALFTTTITAHEVESVDSKACQSERQCKAGKKEGSTGNGSNEVDTSKDDSNIDHSSDKPDKPNKSGKKGGR